MGLRLTGIEYGALGEISGPDVCGGGECIAGVLAHCGAKPDPAGTEAAEAGTAGMAPCRMGLLAMESEDAFALFQLFASGEEILETYKAWGSSVVAEAAQALAGMASGAHPGHASLEEDSVIAILVGTHAPSDTVIVTLRLELISPSGETSTPGFVYLLVDPKLFGATLADLAAMAA